jgi:cobaltochelatase CobS
MTDTDTTTKPVEKEEMEFMRLALNVPSRIEVDTMIEKKIMSFNVLNKIELIRPDDIAVKLPDNPRHHLFPDILATINIGLPLALIGPAGSGKSTCVEQAADALTMPFYLQNGVTGTHELTGYMDAFGKYHSTAFRAAFEHGGLCFVDEADTSDAGAFKWINTAVANGYAMFPDSEKLVKRHKDFRIVIGANTFGTGADRLYVGANQLDASTLDRFVFIEFGYDEKLEKIISGNIKFADRVQKLRKAAVQEKARIVISPRATIHGAKLLDIGWKQIQVENAVIWKGIDRDLRERIEKRAA